MASNETLSCHRCNVEIQENDDYISAPGVGVFHDYCFKCDQCFEDFPDDIYYEFENTGKLYCKCCFDLLYSPICAGCGQPLTGTYKIAMGKKWHSECLVCATCWIELWKNGAGFKQAPDGRALCQVHYEEERALGLGFLKECLFWPENASWTPKDFQKSLSYSALIKKSVNMPNVKKLSKNLKCYGLKAKPIMPTISNAQKNTAGRNWLLTLKSSKISYFVWHAMTSKTRYTFAPLVISLLGIFVSCFSEVFGLIHGMQEPKSLTKLSFLSTAAVY